jgi:chromosome partitioning protein
VSINEASPGLLDPLSGHSDGSGGTLAEPAANGNAKVGDLKNFHSLVPHAQALRRAIFELAPDKVIWGDQFNKAKNSETQFRDLCEEIIRRIHPGT